MDAAIRIEFGIGGVRFAEMHDPWLAVIRWRIIEPRGAQHVFGLLALIEYLFEQMAYTLRIGRQARLAAEIVRGECLRCPMKGGISVHRTRYLICIAHMYLHNPSHIRMNNPRFFPALT